jgi:hypothetical protein
VAVIVAAAEVIVKVPVEVMVAQVPVEVQEIAVVIAVGVRVSTEGAETVEDHHRAVLLVHDNEVPTTVV